MGRDDVGMHDWWRLSRTRAASESKPSHPRNKTRKEESTEKEWRPGRIIDLKRQIWRLTIDQSLSARQIMDELKRNGDPEISLVTVGNLRMQIIEVVKYLRCEGLINERRLERRQSRRERL